MAKTEAQGRRAVAEIDAEAEVGKARGQAEATAIKGRAQAEARAELFRRMLTLEPAMDRATLWAILRRLRSDEELQFMGKLYAATSDRTNFDNLLGATIEGGEGDEPRDRSSNQ